MENRENKVNNSSEKSVFTEEVELLSQKQYFINSVGEACLKAVLWIVDFILSIFLSLGNFFLMVGKGAVKGFFAFINFFKRKAHQFKYNDIFGRISFGVFGVSSIRNKQFVNGIFYFLFEVGYIIFFILVGIPALAKLPALGPAGNVCVSNCGSMFEEIANVGNSMLILIYALLVILSIFIFLFVWNKSINAGYNLYRIKHFIRFDDYSKECLQYSSELSSRAIESFKNKVKKSDFKKKESAAIKEYVANIAGDKEKTSYIKYLLNLTIDQAYVYCKQKAVLNKKIQKLEDKKQEIIDRRTATLQYLMTNEKDVETFKLQQFRNKTLSIVSKREVKINKIVRSVADLDKRYSCAADRQNTINNDKYGKFNFFYKHISDLDNKILFWNNYKKFADIYLESLKHSDEQNEKNRVQGVNLTAITNEKLKATEEKFASIIDRRKALENELLYVRNVYNEKVLDIKTRGGTLDEMHDAKAVLIDETTRINRALSDLPTQRTISTLKKEEIRETKHAYRRDKRYLKTNFTPESYARQCVIDNMLLEYKIDYKSAVAFANIIHKQLTSDAALEQLTSDAVIQCNNLVIEKEKYVKEHQNKYVGKPATFIEQVKSLLNNNFHITILALPLLGIVLFTIVPLLFSILVAFTNYSAQHRPDINGFEWIGFENFITIFNPPIDSIYKDIPSALMSTLGWTLIWAVAATFSNYFLGIIVALMINKNSIKFKKLWRTIFVLTIAVPQFISLLSIATLIKDNGALGKLFLDITGSKLGFATSQNVAMTKIIIILVNVWVGIPYTILSTTGILLNIPKDLYESSTVDGAGAFTQFTKITLPYILFVTGPYLITQFVGNINNFNVIFFLTGGDPAVSGASLPVGETDLLITFLYELVIGGNSAQYGIASTIGILVFIICSFFSIIVYNKSGSIQEEDTFQ